MMHWLERHARKTHGHYTRRTLPSGIVLHTVSYKKNLVIPPDWYYGGYAYTSEYYGKKKKNPEGHRVLLLRNPFLETVITGAGFATGFKAVDYLVNLIRKESRKRKKKR